MGKFERDMRALKAVLFWGLVFGLALWAATARADVGYQDIAKHIVMVYAKDGTCTGTVVGKNLVLTNKHCVDQKDVFVSDFEVQEPDDWAEKKKNPQDLAKVVAVHPKLDMALLEVQQTGQAPVTRFAMPVLDEQIVVVSYSRGQLSINRGRITRIAGAEFNTDTALMRGSSGACVFNVRDECVGLVYGFSVDGVPVTIQVPVPSLIGPPTVQTHKFPVVFSILFSAYEAFEVQKFLAAYQREKESPKALGGSK